MMYGIIYSTILKCFTLRLNTINHVFSLRTCIDYGVVYIITHHIVYNYILLYITEGIINLFAKNYAIILYE